MVRFIKAYNRGSDTIFEYEVNALSETSAKLRVRKTAIRMLLSRGIKPKNVEIIDTRGRLVKTYAIIVVVSGRGRGFTDIVQEMVERFT